MTTGHRTPGACRPGERIEGLYAWRALLMLAGVMLHATMGHEDVPALAAINIVSGSFRMGTFFMISGLLSGFALLRRDDPAAWMRGRIYQVGVPTLFGLAVICPAIELIEAPSGAAVGTINPYHLWFLVALLAYTLFAYAVHRVDLSWRVFEHVERRSSTARALQLALIGVTGLLSFILMGLAFPVMAAAPARWQPLLRELPLLTGYAPTFLLSFTAARAATVRRTLIASVRVPVLVLVCAAIALLERNGWLGTLPPLGPWCANIVLVACAAWCPPAATALILRSAMAIRRVPAPLRLAADASFTIYILHYPVIAALKHWTTPLAFDPWQSFAVLTAVGGLVPYAIHRTLVKRSPLLRLLLNGQPLSQARAPTLVSQASGERPASA